MEKAYIVEFSFLTRVVIPEKDEFPTEDDFYAKAVEASREQLISKCVSELHENVVIVEEDNEVPHQEKPKLKIEPTQLGLFDQTF